MSVLRCAVHYSAVANWQYCTLYVCAFVYCVDIIVSVPFGASSHFGTVVVGCCHFVSFVFVVALSYGLHPP